MRAHSLKTNHLKPTTQQSTKITATSRDPTLHLAETLQSIVAPRLVHLRHHFLRRLLCPPPTPTLLAPQLSQFLSHCATLIQAQFRGYQQRKYYRMFRPIMRRLKQLLNAAVMGWRVRRIMGLGLVKRKVGVIGECVRAGKGREARIARRDLVDEVARLACRGMWLSYVDRGAKRERTNKRGVTLRMVKNQIKQGNEGARKESGKQETKDRKKQDKAEKESTSVQQRQRQLPKQQQIPIKSTGFYNIPQQQSPDDPPQPTPVPKQKKKQVPRQLQSTAPIPLPQQPVDSSHIDIRLPIQQFHFAQSPSTTVMRRHMKSLQKTNNPERDHSAKRQDRKGITVTLTMGGKPGDAVVTAMTGISSKQFTRQQAEGYRGQLQEIVAVYKSSYSMKKQQILGRIQATKAKSKYT